MRVPMNLRVTKTKKIIALCVLCPILLFFFFKWVTLKTNDITFVYPKVVEIQKTETGAVAFLNWPVIAVHADYISPVVIEKTISTKSCEWSRECVEAYIEEIGGEDKVFVSWAKYVAAHEGGYNNQYDQANYKDIHQTYGGRTFVGSFGQFQFGEPTYKANCEPTGNWKMDWKAQVRCAKKLFDNGSYKSAWLINTRGWLNQIAE